MLLFVKDQINLGLSIEDYLPVLLFAGGLFFIAKTVAATNKTVGKLAFIGGILITSGGLCKATWKVIQAFDGNDIPFLNNSLFVFMAAGFICLAWAFYNRNSNETGFMKIAVIPFMLIFVIYGISVYFALFTESRVWFFILLGATTAANSALLFQLIFASFQNKLWFAMLLFVINSGCIFILARSSDQTVTFQWIKQIVNTFSQISFLTASIFLSKVLIKKQVKSS